MKTPLVSIVIPTYNYAQYLPEAIDSALAQTYKNIELLIVDDGSTDDTGKVIKKYKNHLRYYYKTNGGLSSARNFASPHINGEYVVFLDADNKLASNYVQKTLDLLLRQSKQVGYIYTQLQVFEAINEVTQFSGFRANYLTVSNYIDACCLMKADIARQTQYDVRLKLWEDWDFYLTLLENGITGTLLNEPLLFYRRHHDGKSLSDHVSDKKRLDSYHIIRMKHWRMYGLTQTGLYLAWYAARRCHIVKGVKA